LFLGVGHFEHSNDMGAKSDKENNDYSFPLKTTNFYPTQDFALHTIVAKNVIIPNCACRQFLRKVS